MLQEIKSVFQKNQNTEFAYWSYKYMKEQFPFYGIKHPLRTSLIKPFIKTSINTDELLKLVFDMTEEKEREFIYTAIDFVTHNIKKFSYEEFKQLEQFFNINPWWDSIDRLQKSFSLWTTNHIELKNNIAKTWSSYDSIWSKRSAIILQLHLKDKVDTELLQDVILENKDINEFFIQKAIGWALRDYSKHNALWVKNFLEECNLSNLAQREASKYLFY